MEPGQHNGFDGEHPEPEMASPEELARDRRDAVIVISVIFGGFLLGIIALLASIVFS